MNDERKLTNAAAKGTSGKDDDRFLPIPVYCRVSTGDPDQKSSCALQTNYYNDLLRKHTDDGHKEIGGNAYE